MRSPAKAGAIRCRQLPRSTESYDLVVVGGGISGLAAAWFYRRARPPARILILDNHDDFGGHAKRNEFTLDGRRIIGYGGSQSLQSPNSLYSPVAKGLLRDLGVDIKRFETAFERELYPSLGLSRGTVLQPRSVRPRRAGDRRAGARQCRRDARAAMPGRCRSSSPIFRFRTASKAQILALYAGATRSAGRQVGAREARDPEAHQLSRLPDQDLRLQRGGRQLLSGPPARLLRPRQRRGAGGRRARSRLSGLCRPRSCRAAPTRPGASPTSIISRTATRRWRGCWSARSFPRVAPGSTMDDVVEARVRLRRGSTEASSRSASASIDLRRTSREAGDKVHVAYVRDGALRRVEARHVVLACFHMMIPHIMPELPRAAARGACQERQDADLLHQRAGPQLACLRQPQGQFDPRADGLPPSGVARLSGQPRRLPPSARSVRADAAASGPRAGRAEPGARCARPVPHRAGQALRDDVRGFRGAHSRRSRPHARAGRLLQRARYRGDHRQPLAARLQLRGQFAVRSGRLRRHGAQAGAAAIRAVSRSPTPTPAATPGCISRSIRRTGR